MKTTDFNQKMHLSFVNLLHRLMRLPKKVLFVCAFKNSGKLFMSKCILSRKNTSLSYYPTP